MSLIEMLHVLVEASPLTFWVQQLGEPQFLLSHIESILEIVVSIGPLQVVELN